VFHRNTRSRVVFRHAVLAPKRRGFLDEWAVTIVVLLASATVVQAFVIPSGSMEGTLLIGDHVVVDRLVYSPPDSVSRHLLPYRDVRRGDVIVFRYPLDLNKTLVKRAIGIPGDHVRLENKRVILNGRAVYEPFAKHLPGYMPYRDDFPTAARPIDLRPEATAMLDRYVSNGELVVPPGAIFAMGDNRENSDDSRFWGLVPRKNIVGTPVLVYWSFDAPESDLEGDVGINHLIDVITHFFSKTRWDRTFHLIR
jgi:signal peptidase I